MSLINDALKKAQRQQTGGAPAPTPGEAAPTGGTPRIERREKPADFRSQMLILGGVSLGLLLALVVGGFFWWRGSHPSEPVATPQVAQVAPPAATAPKPATSAASAPAETKPEPVKIEPTPAAPATATASTGAPQFTLPLATPTSAPATATPPASTTTAQAAVQLPAATPSAEAVKAPPAERPKASAQMVKLIEGFRVTGIRASGGDSKVLMNDRVYRVGDTVDIDLGLKLTGVAQGALTFENAQGAVYTRNF